MTQLNKDEFGQTIYIDMGENVLAATELTIVIEPRLGTLKEKLNADGVTVGTTNITVDNVDLLANEYLQYTIKADDLDFAGLWRKKGKALLTATNIVISDYTRFTVLD
jgi:hypothetical protein